MLAICIVLLPSAGRAQAGAEAGNEAGQPGAVDAMIEHARATYLPRARTRCGAAGAGADGEIVVCAPDRGEDQRVPSTSESDPASREARRERDNGVPRAPDFARLPGCAAPGALCGGYAPPPIYIIDLKAIPEPPAGSDAEKIANGEMASP